MDPHSAYFSSKHFEGAIWCGSQLERTAYQSLKMRGIYFRYQYDFPLLGDESWNVDFYLPQLKLVLECKGPWICDQDSELQRLLKLQILILQSKGITVKLVNIDRFVFRDFEVEPIYLVLGELN